MPPNRTSLLSLGVSGVFAGLTLAYMGLDETQSNVLSISGSCLTTIHTSPPNSDVSSCEQKRNAEKIKPTRKNGHLVILLLSANGTLLVIANPVLEEASWVS